MTAADRMDSRGSDLLSERRMRLREAFTPSLPVTSPEKFAGRVEQLNSVIRAIEDQRLHIVLYGERGIGKTSLLHVLTKLAREARYYVVYVSCGAASNFDELVRQVADDIPLLFHSDFGPTARGTEEGGTFASVLPANTTISVRHATDLFSKIVGTRVLVLLDEFDRSESVDFRRSVAELLKSLSDRVVRLQITIAGVAADLTQLVEHVPSIQRNLFAQRLGKLDASEVKALLKKGGEQAGLTFEPEAESAIVLFANGIPYLASLISYLSGSNAIDAGRTTIRKDDVSAGVAEALEELKGRISKRSQMKVAECCQRGAHLMLGYLAGRAQTSGGQFNGDDIAALYPTADQRARCQTLVDTYGQKGMLIERLQDDEGAFRFCEESVIPYLWLLASSSMMKDQEVSARAQEPVVATSADA